MATRKANDDLILTALITHTSVIEAARAAGVSSSAVYRRLSNPDFVRRFEAARRDLYDDSAAAIESHMLEAINGIAAIMNDTEASPQTRLNACEAIIRNTLKLTERRDILDRLDDLERRIK